MDDSPCDVVEPQPSSSRQSPSPSTSKMMDDDDEDVEEMLVEEMKNIFEKGFDSDLEVSESEDTELTDNPKDESDAGVGVNFTSENVRNAMFTVLNANPDYLKKLLSKLGERFIDEFTAIHAAPEEDLADLKRQVEELRIKVEKLKEEGGSEHEDYQLEKTKYDCVKQMMEEIEPEWDIFAKDGLIPVLNLTFSDSSSQTDIREMTPTVSDDTSSTTNNASNRPSGIVEVVDIVDDDDDEICYTAGSSAVTKAAPPPLSHSKSLPHLPSQQPDVSQPPPPPPAPSLTPPPPSVASDSDDTDDLIPIAIIPPGGAPMPKPIIGLNSSAAPRQSVPPVSNRMPGVAAAAATSIQQLLASPVPPLPTPGVVGGSSGRFQQPGASSAASGNVMLRRHDASLYTDIRPYTKVYAKGPSASNWILASVLSIDKSKECPYEVCFENASSKLWLSGKEIAYSKSPPENIKIPEGTRVIAGMYTQELNGKNGFYPGIIAEAPTVMNHDRYLIFYDDAYALYCYWYQIYIVHAPSTDPTHDMPLHTAKFVRPYLDRYPERILCRVREGSTMNIEVGGTFHEAKILRVDAALMKVEFQHNNRVEWLFRGSMRLAPIYKEYKYNVGAFKSPFRLGPVTQPQSDQQVEQQPSRQAEPQPRRQMQQKHSQQTEQQPNQQILQQQILPQPIQQTPQQPNQQPPQQPNQQPPQQPIQQPPQQPIQQANQKTEQTPQKPEAQQQKPPVIVDIAMPSTSRGVGNNEPRPPLISKRPMARKSASKKVPISVDRAMAKAMELKAKSKYFAYAREESAEGTQVCYRAFTNANRELYKPHDTCSKECLGSKHAKGHRFVYKEKNPMVVPCVFGFERLILLVRPLEGLVPIDDSSATPALQNQHAYKVVYRTPCQRCLRTLDEVHQYLLQTESSLTIDLFSFDVKLHITRHFKYAMLHMKCTDLSYGKESIPISCVNEQDNTMPGYMEYSRHRIPDKDVPLNINTDFLVYCDCTDGCSSLSCACRRLTHEESIRLDMHPGGHAGYHHRLLDSKVHSGIYECNKKCHCRFTCNNRVVQQPLSNRLQVFKTTHCGWGLRCLHDIPKGAFICVYAGRLLTDTKGDQEGKDEGDEYFAELDFIDIVEGEKDGYESEAMLDLPSGSSSTTGEENSSDADDVRPPRKKSATDKNSKSNSGNGDDKASGAVAKTTGAFGGARMSVRTLFNDDNIYLTDAREVGNIGRYLNHSCEPNVFVQNVFVDTHDPRFPWVAFFAQEFIPAGEELRWVYGYQIDSVPGKELLCYCFSTSCAGRLL